MQAEAQRVLTREEIVELADAVAASGGIATGIGTNRYGAQLIVQADSREEAVEKATGEFTAAAARNPQIIADLGALDYIDCCALGVLNQVRAQVWAAGGDLLLAAPHGLVLRILTLTGLSSVFSVHNSLEEAARTADARAAP